MTRDLGHDEFYSWDCCCDPCLDAQLAGTAQLLERMHDLMVTARDLSLRGSARTVANESRAAIESELDVRRSFLPQHAHEHHDL